MNIKNTFGLVIVSFSTLVSVDHLPAQGSPIEVVPPDPKAKVMGGAAQQVLNVFEGVRRMGNDKVVEHKVDQVKPEAEAYLKSNPDHVVRVTVQVDSDKKGGGTTQYSSREPVVEKGESIDKIEAERQHNAQQHGTIGASPPDGHSRKNRQCTCID
ncbi:hypothetical protein [Verrucomicrobium spinosum]|uniref:hypothetical protein n=1 Tax=Verrucomicrobium spinosum TaxID=2736 RepID=UPI0012E13799|nr:hypothetical protein [Verrucomicrobium spinosum]